MSDVAPKIHPDGAREAGGTEGGGTDRRVPLRAVIWGLATACVVLTLLWSRTLQTMYLVAAGLAWVSSLVPVLRPRGRDAEAEFGLPGSLHLALFIGLLGLLAGFATSRRLHEVGTRWEEVTATRQVQLAAELDRRMDQLVRLGERTAVLSAEAAREYRGRELFARLEELRERSGVASIAVLDEAGELVSWAGEHRGMLPAPVRAGRPGVYYAERPLFSYLYFSAPREAAGATGHAVAAILLQTGLPLEGGEARGFADRFAARTGVLPQFGVGAGADAPWRLVSGTEPVVHARFQMPTQADWHEAVAQQGQRAVVVLGLLALVLLAFIRPWPGRRFGAALPLGLLALALWIAPLGPALGLEWLFSPGLFLLPLPGDVSLGALLALLIPLGALAASARPQALDRGGARGATVLGALAVALGFAGGIRLFLAGASRALLEDGSYQWVALDIAAVLLLTMLAALALPREVGAERGRARGLRPVAWVVGVVGAAVLALVVMGRWSSGRPVTAAWGALWAIPFVGIAVGLAPGAARPVRLLRWLAAGWLAATAVLPQLWIGHVEARLEAAERELVTLGVRPDPYLEYLLHRFAEEVVRRDAREERGTDLLYRSWVASGLARETYTLAITLWKPDGTASLRLGLGSGRAGLRWPNEPGRQTRAVMDEAARLGKPVVVGIRATPDAGQLVAVPLRDGSSVTMSVPPRRSLERPAFLPPFVVGGENAGMRLTLVPAEPGAKPGAPPVWRRGDEGWHGESVVPYPDGVYRANVEIRFPPAGVLFARGVLILALDIGALLLLWLLARAASRDRLAPAGGWRRWVGSFRARVTLALFGFFLLPTAIFGWIAFRAMAGEAARTARVVAERAVVQADTMFQQAPGDLARVAAWVGEEVLYYHRGELARASSPDALSLGLYSAWMPPPVYLALRGGEEITSVEVREHGHRPYVVAYHRMPGGTLAVPAALASGEAARRQRELAHLALFAVVMGGLLSLALSLVVGRALAQPIGQLRRAYAAVGAGRLGVRLPEAQADEFGELFASFNRMARRLRRARTREARTARVLAWGEMARQVAHEIKNPLTPIKLSVQHLRRTYAAGRPDFGEILEASTNEILREIERLTEIARAFSRYGVPPEASGPLEPVDVEAVVHEALTLYRTGDGAVRYEVDVEPGLPRVRARAGELKEVLLNLLENARAALEGSGAVRVSASRGAEAIELAVADDGKGIAPELLTKVFDPHFSTRSSGTGLGLAIVRRLVDSWGGSVWAESEPGRGTTVRVRMAVAEGGPAPRLQISGGSGN